MITCFAPLLIKEQILILILQNGCTDVEILVFYAKLFIENRIQKLCGKSLIQRSETKLTKLYTQNSCTVSILLSIKDCVIEPYFLLK